MLFAAVPRFHHLLRGTSGSGTENGHTTSVLFNQNVFSYVPLQSSFGVVDVKW